MRKMKCKTVIIAMLMLMALTISASTVQADGTPRTVFGWVKIDGNLAPAGTAIKITFLDEPPEPLIIEMYTDENGNYSVTFPVDDWADGDFSVNYLGVWYTPIPSTIEIEGTHKILYPINLSVDTTSVENNPPNAPSLVAPSDGSTVSGTTSATLQVSVSDPNTDPMEVSFYNANGDTLLSTSSGVASGSTASYSWTGLTADTTYTWYAIADDGEFAVQSATWSFTTATSGGGGNGGGNGGGTSGGPTYTAPIADANGPYYEFLDKILGYAEVTFDGSGSTGTITSYSWDFGDGATGSGVSPTHRYYTLDNFTVILNVTGPLGYNISQTFAVISMGPNLPPTAPTVSGPQTGSADTDYDYTAVSTDDDNDTLKYIFDWNDGTTTTTDFYANGTAVTESHNWSAAGVYTIKVKASDNATESGTTNYVVLIDALWVKTIGYLLDTNGDGTYNSFYSNETGATTATEEQDDGTYYINSDEDSGWDWVYDPPDTDTLTEYTESEKEPEEDSSIWYMLGLGIILVILLLLGIYYATKKKPKKKKPKKTKK